MNDTMLEILVVLTGAFMLWCVVFWARWAIKEARKIVAKVTNGKPNEPETWISRRSDNRWLLTCADGGGERSKYPYGGRCAIAVLYGYTYPILSRRRALTRNGLTVCVVDRRESYRERRAAVGYEQVVSDADKQKATDTYEKHFGRVMYSWWERPPSTDVKKQR